MKNLILLGILGLLAGCNGRYSDSTEIKVNDQVVITKNCVAKIYNGSSRITKIGETAIIEISSHRSWLITETDNIRVNNDCFKKVAETPKKELKFKVGDKVRIISDDSDIDGKFVGINKEIVAICDNNIVGGTTYSYKLDVKGGTCWADHELELTIKSQPLQSKYQNIQEYLNFQKICKKYNSTFKTDFQVEVTKEDVLMCGNLDQVRIKLEMEIVEKYLRSK